VSSDDPASVAWHALTTEAAAARLGASARTGLSEAEVESRRAQWGPNALPEPTQRSLLSVFAGQFKNPLIYLLFGAAALSFVFGHASDAVVIGVVVLLNAVIGAFQEGRAQRSLAQLRRLSTLSARVVREGVEARVEARALVPGDVVLLEAGDAVPADARLTEAAALMVSEAALTGESVPVHKTLDVLPNDAALPDRRCMLYAGTHLAAGRARALVVATGPRTEVGRIAALTTGAREPRTPLERRIDAFGRGVLWAAAGLFMLVLGLGALEGRPLDEMLLVAISQVVGLVPEGLPVAMTVALSVGVLRMARRKAVVRRLAAVETLGSTAVVCTDKTGTLTRNEMTSVAVVLPGGAHVRVDGVGYAPEGRLQTASGDAALDTMPDLTALMHAAALCNDARLLPPTAPGGAWRTTGDPTEAALITLVSKAGLDADALRAAHPRVGELPFDPARALMATAHAHPAPFVVVKGAPEAVLSLCDLTIPEAAQVRATVESLAGEALRVLAFARVNAAGLDAEGGFDALRGRATLLGLVGQIDPPRLEVRDAVQACWSAGVRPVMLTGDHKATGEAIGRTLGLLRPGDIALDGVELAALSDEALAAQVDRVGVFARVQPTQKLRIVRALQARGHVVAMTGDGVNDAPALAQADVGVAMGLTGTEVAKEASKIILADDNFATIVAAVEEGRVVYRNIKKAVLLLFSTAVAEVVVLVGALLLGHAPPFPAVQILWNNLVTEGLITVNLVMEPAEGDEMSRPPIPPDEPLLTRLLYVRMAFMVPAIAASVLGWYVWRTQAGAPADVVRTEAFTLLAICEWLNVLNCRSELRSGLSLSVLRNRWLLGGLLLGNLLQVAVVYWRPLGDVFHTAPIDLDMLGWLFVAALPVLGVEEARKWAARRALRLRA
jgi:magnesium-transporting ATPase (P-type)